MTFLPDALRNMRERAECATPGPYFARCYPDCLPLIKMPSDEIQDITRREDAVHLAGCWPERILALIDVAQSALAWSRVPCHGSELNAAEDDLNQALGRLGEVMGANHE